MKLIIDIPEKWFDDMVREEFTEVDELCAVVQHGIPLEQEPNVEHCEECKHFRKLPHHADKLGRCMQHTGFCPKSDWYCADYEPEEEE